jgi:hypothetical protein
MDIIKMLGSDTIYTLLIGAIAKDYVKKGTAAAIRAFTIPERDTRKLCKSLAIKDEDQIKRAITATRAIAQAIGSLIDALTNTEPEATE